MVPSFLIDPTVIWLDFEGSGLPESRKIEKKMLLDVFLDFGVDFEVSFGDPGCKKSVR